MGYDSPVPPPLRPVGGWKKNVTVVYISRARIGCRPQALFDLWGGSRWKPVLYSIRVCR